VFSPLISRALGEYSRFRPLLVGVSEAECLRDDAYAFELIARLVARHG